MGDPKPLLEYSLTVSNFGVVPKISEVISMVGYFIDKVTRGLMKKVFSVVGVGE